MKKIELEIEKAKNFLIRLLYVDFNLITINPKLKKWHTMTWETFYDEISKEKIDLTKCKHRNWKVFFENQQRRVHFLTNQLYQEINKLD